MRHFVSMASLLLAVGGAPHAAAALSNQLAGHPSPYLAMHADDPVAWQDWSEEAVAAAREQGKLLYISIGYFSCHWCHVMQHESYRNQEIAALLNEHYIPVKVDRELEPALDARLIEFAEATQGQAGWPLNVFLTPEGHPLYAVLYLPPENFQRVLERLQQVWRQDRDNLADIARRDALTARGPGAPQLDPRTVERYTDDLVASAQRIADTLAGGFGTQNKFPSVPQLEFLLRYAIEHPGSPVRGHLVLTLEQMAAKGLYDHIGGGFFRYTVDPGWTTPHFEKMLYDNALLARLYLRAGTLLERGDFTAVARATLDFMLRDMVTPSGAMVASFSAVDGDNVEGGYYLWSADELRAVLGAEDYRLARSIFNLRSAPPFEAGWLPMRDRPRDVLAKELELEPAAVDSAGARIGKALLAARAERKLPVDTKLLAGWNGLALASLAEAASVLDEARYREGARRIRDYLVDRLWSDTGLARAVDGDRAIGSAAVEDYAYVAAGLLAWADLTHERADYEQAAAVVREAWKRFYTTRGWRLAERTLITPEDGRDVLGDGPMPAASGIVAAVSLRLAQIVADPALGRQALAALNSGHEALSRNPFAYATQVGAMRAALTEAAP